MKRYLIFGFDRFYPSGGWEDFISAFDGYDEAMRKALDYAPGFDYMQIVDTQTMTIIYQTHKDDEGNHQ